MLNQLQNKNIGIILSYKWDKLISFLRIKSKIKEPDVEFMKYKECIIQEIENILRKHNFSYKLNNELYLAEQKHLLTFNLLIKDLNNSFVKYFIKDIYPIEITVSPNASELLELNNNYITNKDIDISNDLINYLSN